jgi:hypothetical protein
MMRSFLEHVKIYGLQKIGDQPYLLLITRVRGMAAG